MGLGLFGLLEPQPQEEALCLKGKTKRISAPLTPLVALSAFVVNKL